jgi:hypothetical protein
VGHAVRPVDEHGAPGAIPMPRDAEDAGFAQGEEKIAEVRRPDYWKRGFLSMIRRLEKRDHAARSAAAPRRPGAWTPERRARQSALIRRWQPWRRATGPTTDAGKARCAMNGLKHGFRSRAYIERRRQARRILRVSARNLAILRNWLRARAAGVAPKTVVGLESILPLFAALPPFPASLGAEDSRIRTGHPRKPAVRAPLSPKWYWPGAAGADTVSPVISRKNRPCGRCLRTAGAANGAMEESRHEEDLIGQG